MEALAVILFICLASIIWCIFIYNHLVSQRNRFKNAFAQIDVQLRRRYDLIPNLIETAKAYLSHEHDTLEAVITARNHALSAVKKASRHPDSSAAVTHLAQAEATLGQALLQFHSITEAYPNLKADQTIQQLTEELTSTENKVSFARQAYNDEVMDYNTACEIFPNVLLAKALGFHHAHLFKIEETKVKQPIHIQL